VDFYQYVPNFPTPTCFGIWLPSSGGRECLISDSSNVLCYGRVRTMTRPVWPVAFVCLFTNDNVLSIFIYLFVLGDQPILSLVHNTVKTDVRN
jgi:hypothetical protein